MKIQVDAEVEEERLKMKIPVDVEVEEECSKWTMRVDEEEEEELHSIRFLFVLALDAEPLVLACNDEVAPDHKAFLVPACNDEVEQTDTRVDICSSYSVLAGYRSFPVSVGVRIYCLQEDEQSYQVSVDICSSYSDVDVSVDIRSSFEDEEAEEAHRSFLVSASVPLFYC